VIHGPNMCDARDNTVFFAFQMFLVEVNPNKATIESGPNHITAVHTFVIATLRYWLQATLGHM